MQLPFACDVRVLVGGPQRDCICVSACCCCFRFMPQVVTLHIEHRQSCRPISFVCCVDIVSLRTKAHKEDRLSESCGLKSPNSYPVHHEGPSLACFSIRASPSSPLSAANLSVCQQNAMALLPDIDHTSLMKSGLSPGCNFLKSYKIGHR